MNLYRILAILIIYLTVCSCAKKNNSTSNEWDGKEIIFPKNVVLMSQNDTIKPDFEKQAKKIVVYADTSGCMGCKLQLDKWKHFASQINYLSKDSISYLFFLNPIDVEEMMFIIEHENFTYPVCFDTNRNFSQLNGLTSDQVFLLDTENHIITTGNPIEDSNTKYTYLEEITGRELTESEQAITQASVKQTEYDLGQFQQNKIKELVVEITNTGRTPLVIFDVETNCGCIKARYKKEPVKPQKTATIKLEVTSDQEGSMQKIVNIVANTNEQISIIITGETINRK